MKCSCAATTPGTPNKNGPPGSTANHSNFAPRQRGYLNVAVPERHKLAQLRPIELREHRTINSRDHTHLASRLQRCLTVTFNLANRSLKLPKLGTGIARPSLAQ